MKILKKFSLGSAIVALIAMPAVPVTAAEINVNPAPSATTIDNGEPLWMEDNNDRRRRRYRRRGVSGGDVLIGAAILGGIAILASSSSKSKNRRSDNDYQQAPAPQNYPQQNQQQNQQQGDFVGNDIGSAINACTNAALQSAGNEYQVNQIRNVSRDGEGWRVDGDLIGPQNAGFSCGVSNGGVQFIQLN